MTAPADAVETPHTVESPHTVGLPSAAEPLPTVVELESVTRSYPGGVAALDGVSLTVRRGELTAIVGPSGSGKSTMLNVIGTLDLPTSGSVTIDGHDVAGLSDRQLSALDNVSYGLLYNGVGQRERRERAAVALESVGLGHRLDHRPHELSGGEKQRVAIARAVVGEPAVLLADEPTGALDSRSGAAVMELIHALHAAGTTILVITHDQAIAASLPRRVTMLDGRIQSDSAALLEDAC
ncbi:ABC transporter ATP-binding protein [Streptomyces sp. H27-D2]|uniref:ABC transporter ATP-binding protein n=1 Tax=Streptomyces sp. H27-D2 TaxID=3046304 RepID=UPI002DB8FCC3|nr:ABC transporter ATP-binding protein [Streptomyces sp. H27-D2]MEC4017990.1 ABC transporter ATP-binding protein [Streptomyces sp. H27-D2]